MRKILRFLVAGTIAGLFLTGAVGYVGMKRTERQQAGVDRSGTYTLQALLRDEGYSVDRNLRSWNLTNRMALRAYLTDWELPAEMADSRDRQSSDLRAYLERRHDETRPQYLATIGQSCRVWIQRPRPASVAVWDGACVNGYAEGLGILTTRHRHYGEWVSETFEGQMRRGRADGVGVTVSSLGYRYEGDYRDNLFHGEGRLKFDHGGRYEGEFRSGLPNGQGRYAARDQRVAGKWHRGCYTDGKRQTAVLNTDDGCGFTRGSIVWSALFE